EGALQVRAAVREALVDELEAQRVAHGIEARVARVTRVARERGALAVHLEGEPEPLRARRVLLAIGRTGDQRRLGVPGETLEHVRWRAVEPADQAGHRVLVVGGGDSACEAAIALAGASATVTLVHRGGDLSRAKHANAEDVTRLASEGAIELLLGARVCAIE